MVLNYSVITISSLFSLKFIMVSAWDFFEAFRKCLHFDIHITFCHFIQYSTALFKTNLLCICVYRFQSR